ncbi:heparanase-like [Ostrea edulis]|uniref:heparanase-like n=1 Tax=Ostrea edulis TaxID=37623 RepID=UPI0024AF2337|nr:heparanase-like [Ostrea edulis]
MGGFRCRRCFMIFFLFFGKCQLDTISVTFDANSIRSTTSSQFVGVTLDSGLIRHKWENFDLRSLKVLTLAKGLSPYTNTYLRIGGTFADFCTFTPSALKNDTEQYRKASAFHDLFYEMTRSKPKNQTEFYMSARIWDEIHKFIQEAKFDLIFDLNVLMRTEANEWNSTNAIQLLKYTQRKGYRMAGWELGNEPNSFHHLNSSINVTAESLGQAYYRLSQILADFPTIRGRILTGPSTTQLNKKPTIRYFTSFLETKGGETVTSPNFHQYYVNGRTATVGDFTNSEILDSFEDELKTGNMIVALTGNERKLWLGETSSAYGGGAEGLSDAFVAAFMWLDKLGVSAKNNVDVVMRQSLYGGKYALLDAKTTNPNPDYWLTVLYRRLVGNKVLTTSSSRSPDVRFYTHCSAEGYLPGSVTLYGMNLRSVGVNVTFPQLDGQLKIYLLTAPNQDLKSRFVDLNGVTLEMTSDTSLPQMIPISGTNPVYMPPFSYVFILADEKTYSKACIHSWYNLS